MSEVEQLRHELTTLRVSVARVAQSFRCAGDMQGKSYAELCALAESQPRGWNALCAKIIDEWQIPL